MKTDQYQQIAVFPQRVTAALAQLKERLHCKYEQAYPSLREIIHLVLEEEEAAAWNLSLFPHLLLPDLVEAHVMRLNLQPPARPCDTPGITHDLNATPQLAFA